MHWVAVDLAALGLGLVVVPLYVDDNPDNVAWCVGNAQARLLVVENGRIAAGLARCATPEQPLPPIVVLRHDAEGDAGALAVERFLPAAGDALVADPLPDDALATICFTSGTAGRPKGVMLSHANILANVAQCRATGMARPDDVFLSILPLSHMFERTGGYYLPLSIGAQVVYGRGVAQIADDLVAQAPTAMFAVPRIFERFKARIDQSLVDAPAKRALFDASVARGYRLATGDGDAARPVAGTGVAARGRAAGARPLRRAPAAGGGRRRRARSRPRAHVHRPRPAAAAGVRHDGGVAGHRGESRRRQRAGIGGAAGARAWRSKLAEGGELLVRGPNVMLGYWQNPDGHAGGADADGWLRTGDLAEIIDGRIYIRGRAKDIIVMSNGEKLPPQDAEFAILHDPVFEQVMLVGEGRPFVVLLAVTRETDEKTLIRRANERLKDFPRWARVRRVIATAEPWSVDNGLLTPTLKLKRPLLLKQMAPQIEAAYAEAPA